MGEPHRKDRFLLAGIFLLVDVFLALLLCDDAQREIATSITAMVSRP